MFYGSSTTLKSIYFWALPLLLLACSPRLSRFYAAASTLSFFGLRCLPYLPLRRSACKVGFSVNCPDFAVCRHSSKAPCSKDPQLILRQICDVIMAVVPGLPNRRAPTMDQRISGWTCSRSQNMPHRNSTPLFRKERPDPLPTDFRQLHMKPLHLSAGKVFLDVQIKSDQCEDDGDWFCSFICMLSCIGVNNVLV